MSGGISVKILTNLEKASLDDNLFDHTDTSLYLSFHRRKLLAKIQQTEESLQSAQSKASSLEKVKSKLTGEVDDLSASLDEVGV